MLSVLARVLYLFKVKIVTPWTAGIRLQFVNYHTVVIWKYFRITNSPTYSRALCPKAIMRYLTWPKCAQFGLALSKVGETTTGVKQSLAHRAGLRSDLMGLFNGWTVSGPKWTDLVLYQASRRLQADLKNLISQNFFFIITLTLFFCSLFDVFKFT